MEPSCYLNGQIIPLSQAKVGITDLGMLRGFGIYEGITAFTEKPFHFHDHWRRFEVSAAALGLQIKQTEQDAEAATRELIQRNTPGKRASIRVVLTGGEALGGLEHVPGRETFFIIVEPAVPLPSEYYEKGASLITYEHQRLIPEYKTINYITAVMLQPRRKAAGAVEILFVKDDMVLECATSNIFIVKDGTIMTPADGILKGITRNVTLEIAKDAYTTKEAPVRMQDLLEADEVFMTSSFKDIVPIVRVDEHIIADGAPGPITRDLMERFAAYTEEY